MRAHLRSVFHSLGIRLLVPLLLTVGVVFAVYGVLSYGSMRQHFTQLVQEELQRSSALIQKATHDGMLLNRLGDVQATIERLAEAPDLAAIRIYDKRGEIVIAANKTELGGRIGLDAQPCLSCHAAGAPLSTARLEEIQVPRQGADRSALRHLTVIDNEPACAAIGCHGPVQQEHVLGVLDVEMSMQPLETAVALAQRQLVWATVALMLVIGVIAAVFVRRLVGWPVRQLFAGTQRIAAGDLDTRIEVHGRHELAGLAAAFNHMAEDLGAAQHELRQFSRELEAKVVEKTEEVRRAHGQLLHMEKMASLGKLSATVAHELNNPLSGVLTYAKLVERELQDQPIDAAVRPALQRYLGLIQKECSRCGDIVKNLLLFARHRGVVLAPVDINAVVDHALMLVRHHLQISGLTARVEPLAGDSRVIADAGQLQQGLLALLVNGVEAMRGPGMEGGELSVCVRGDADAVWIDVGDTGCGIDADILPQIFEPFFSTKQEESGVGLGLAVVYGIVQRHGGSIDVESQPGHGTTFHIRLPRQPQTATQGR